MEPGYELFDHTADMGIRVRAETLAELLQPAGAGLYSVIGELVSAGKPRPLKLDLSNADPGVLLRDYLDELLVLFDRDHRWATGVEPLEFSQQRLQVGVTTEAIDRERSVYHREVKAITYHELDVRTIPGGYEAVIIVDI